MKLVKTLLSQRPKSDGFSIALLIFGIMMVIYGVNALHIYPLNHLLAANGEQIFLKHEYWRLFTTSFIHADVHHLAANSLFFMVFAVLLNSYYGTFVFPVLSFLLGSVVNLLTLAYYPAEVTLIGVSGVIYFMAALWITLYLFIDRRKSLSRRFLNAFGISLVLFFPESFEPQVSYLAHGFGFAIGVVTGVVYFSIHKSAIRARESWVDEIEEESAFTDHPPSDPVTPASG